MRSACMHLCYMRACTHIYTSARTPDMWIWYVLTRLCPRWRCSESIRLVKSHSSLPRNKRSSHVTLNSKYPTIFDVREYIFWISWMFFDVLKVREPPGTDSEWILDRSFSHHFLSFLSFFECRMSGARMLVAQPFWVVAPWLRYIKGYSNRSEGVRNPFGL